MSANEVCAECGSDTDPTHFDTDASPMAVLCCECFQAAYPFHDACTHDACDEDKHTLKWDGRTFVCVECGLSSQTLTDHLGHDLMPGTGTGTGMSDSDQGGERE